MTNERDHSLTMRPVASGDNVNLDSGTKSKKCLVTPALVPCIEGTQLEINSELIQSGLSTISVKCERVFDPSFVYFVNYQLDSIKHRNSFRSLHRPDLHRLPCFRKMSRKQLECVLKGYERRDLRKEPPVVPDPGDPATNTEIDPPEEECVGVMLPPQDEPQSDARPSAYQDAHASGWREGGGSYSGYGGYSSVMSEASGSVMSAALPSGMRLHGARGVLSVQTSPIGDSRRSMMGVHPRALFRSMEEVEDAVRRGEMRVILSPKIQENASEMSTDSMRTADSVSTWIGN